MRIMWNRAFILLSFGTALLGCLQEENNPTALRGKVIGVKDGDTIELLVEHESVTVRLADVDSPERSQPFGSSAKRFTSDLCFGVSVLVHVQKKKDRYGRSIGTVLLSDGRILNRELIQAGLAWHYTKYSTDTTYARLEQRAREDSIGLWSQGDAMPPWEWRSRSSK